MKSTDFIVESIGADADEMHRDHEVQMARSDCYNAAKYAIELHKKLQHISEEQGLEGWVQEKITLACDYLRTVSEHFEHEEAMSQELAMPAFTFEGAEQAFADNLGLTEEFNYATCPVHGSYEYHGRHVPPCPKCGYPEAKTRDEYYKSMGVAQNKKKEQGVAEDIQDDELFGQDDTAGHYRAVKNMRRGGNEGGMSLMGYVVSDFATLEKVFGEPDWGPSEESDDKVTCMWSITFGDDEHTTATVYDWKTGGTPMGTHRWHVGGFSSKAVELVEAALKIGGKGAVEENMGQNGAYQQGYHRGKQDAASGKPNQNPWSDKPHAATHSQGYDDGHSEHKQKSSISEMTAGGCGAGGFATGPTAGANFKKTTGVPKKIKNPVKRNKPQIGKGIY